MKVKLFLMSGIVCAAFGCLSVFAQTEPLPSAQMAAANVLFNSQKWAAAAAAYETVLKTETGNGMAWRRLGQARYSLKQYAPAAAAFEKNIAISSNPFSMFDLACVYSLLGEKEKAIEWLTKTINNPNVILPAVNFDDADLAGIRQDERVKAMAEKVDRQLRPCKYSAEAKQFDFFIGEWDAYNPQGNKTGTSVIQSIAGGCGILENWSDAFGGGGGKSINFYDNNTKKWHQYWIGQNAIPLRYSGVYKDNAIRYEGEAVGANGKKVLTRLTFFNVDAETVRQLAENSADEGSTWKTLYDFKYVRKTAK